MITSAIETASGKLSETFCCQVVPPPKPNEDSGLLRKRAYRLARSGVCKTLVEISDRLRIDGYSQSSIGALLQENTCADLARIIRIADNM